MPDHDNRCLCLFPLAIALLITAFAFLALGQIPPRNRLQTNQAPDEEISRNIEDIKGLKETDIIKSIALKVITGTSIDHPKSVLLSPDGKFAYVQNLYAHNVTVIDAKSYKILKTIPLEGRACEAAITKDGKYLWVSLAALEDDKGTYPPYIPEPTPGWEKYNFPSVVNVIDTSISHGTVVATISVEVKPKILCFSPDERYVLVSNFNSGTVSVIDATTRKVIKTLKAGTYPRGICFLDHGRFAYIANMGSHNISVINMEKLEVERTIPLKAIPRHLISSPDGEPIIFGTNASKKGKLFKLDPKTGSELAAASVGATPRTFVVASNGRLAFVGNYRSACVSVVDVAAMKEIGRIKTSKLPIGLALTPDEKHLWVTSFRDSSITIYDVSNYIKRVTNPPDSTLK